MSWQPGIGYISFVWRVDNFSVVAESERPDEFSWSWRIWHDTGSKESGFNGLATAYLGPAEVCVGWHNWEWA